ncbi:heterokaryon incompatibility protein-domain-containing protein, partial [Tricladium varicosporioides]
MYKDPVHDSNLDHVKRKLQDGLKRYQDHPDTPKFEALSYAWKLNEEEETTPNKPGEAFVFCGNENTRKPLPVTINCKLALQYLRHPSETRVIFVDAICIDQNNLEERSQQVALMGEIYGKAENVLVWLGPATEDSDLAMHCIERFAVKMSDRHGNEFQRLSFMWDPLDRTYFDRLWPLQETTCARSSEFICGERVVPWKSFQYTYAFLAKRYEMSDQILERYKRFLTHDCLRAVANLFTFMSQGPEQKAVSEYAGSIFTASASFSCGEPQDKVYAVYWILKD